MVSHTAPVARCSHAATRLSPSTGRTTTLTSETPDPPRWLLLSALVPPPGEEFLIVDALHRLGARAVERRGERVLAWLPAPPAVASLIATALAAIRASTSLHSPDVLWEWRTHAEWEARWADRLEARRVSGRIVVAPAERVPPSAAGDIVILIEAGAAFGTAEHATTRGCLRLLERRLRPGDAVLDIGTGSGVLAIAAARLGAGTVLGLEADRLACGSARRNAAANGVTDRVEVRALRVRSAHLRAMPPHDLILANLEAALLHTLLPGMRNCLAEGGTLIVAGVTGGEWPAFLGAAAAAGLALREVETVDGWQCAALGARCT